ncbi:MAG TPA: c-type cytochrome [Rhodanobacteraceae bacterium]|nr:c-type cytochrome [Rhodanobacteraceae bacterium]
MVTLATAAPIALALSAPPASHASAKPATSTSTSSSAPASSAGAAAPASSAGAAKAAEAEFTKLKAVKTSPGDPKAGQGKAAACGACHGMDGNSTIAQYPKLAGQSEQYIVTQLLRFKSGTRQNAIMQGMAAALSPQDMHDIGAYFATQKRLPGVADEKLAEVGEKLYREGDASRNVPACMACHGPDGAGNPGWRVPDIGGQHADYIQQQLQAWHDGTSWGSDTHAQIMPTIAQRLTEKDITAVSSYVEGLHAAPAPESSTTSKAID